MNGKIKSNKSSFLTGLIFLSLTCALFAQSKTGTTIGQFLKIGPSARATAMGEAAVSLSGEAMSAYYNPASLGRLNQTQVQFTHSNWLAGIKYDYVIAAIYMADLGTFSLQATSLNSGEIKVRTVEQPEGTGENYTVQNITLGAGYGMMLTNRVSVGLQVNYMQETIWHSSIQSVALNLGVQFETEENGLTLGASISNFGTRGRYDGRDLYFDHDFDPDLYGDNDKLPSELRTEYYSLPVLFRVGISYPLQFGENNRIQFSADALHPNDNNESVNLGLEWNLFRNYALRAGYRNLFLSDAEGGLVLGGGLFVDVPGYVLKFDYAWADYNRLEETHRFTIGLGF